MAWERSRMHAAVTRQLFLSHQAITRAQPLGPRRSFVASSGTGIELPELALDEYLRQSLPRGQTFNLVLVVRASTIHRNQLLEAILAVGVARDHMTRASTVAVDAISS